MKQLPPTPLVRITDFVFKLENSDYMPSSLSLFFFLSHSTLIFLRESPVIVLMVITCLGQLTSTVIFLKVKSEEQELKGRRERFLR